MLYIRYPLSLRQVEDILFETWHRYLSRDGAVLVESVCSGVRWRDQEAARRPAQLVELALAS